MSRKYRNVDCNGSTQCLNDSLGLLKTQLANNIISLIDKEDKETYLIRISLYR